MTTTRTSWKVWWNMKPEETQIGYADTSYPPTSAPWEFWPTVRVGFAVGATAATVVIAGCHWLFGN